MNIWFAVVLALLLSVMPTTPALAQPFEHAEYLLVNWGSRLCLQPEYEDRINGLAIVQQPCNENDPYQRWSFEGGFLNGIYRIINSGSGQCLDDRDGKTADWSPVQQWPCNLRSTTMKWKLDTVGRPGSWVCAAYRCQFKNIRSGKCLDVRGGSSAPGAAIQIYRCTSTGNVESGRANLAQVFELWGPQQPR